MSSISIEINNENKLTVQEYVRLVKIKDSIQQFLDNAKTRELLYGSERSINGLTIDLVVRFSVNR